MGINIVKYILFVLMAMTVMGCESNTVSNYFTKLPTSAQLQFGSDDSSQTWTPYTSFNVGTAPFSSKSQAIVYLSNLGQLPATIQQLWVDSTTTNYYSVQSQCGNVIPASSAPCQVTITFVPNTIGATSANLHVSYQNGNGVLDETSLPLNGSGSNLAYLQYQQSSESAPSDTVSSNQAYVTSVTYNVIYNGSALGAAGLKIDPAQGVIISSPSDSSFKIDTAGTTCGDTVSANCVVKVDFSPSTTGTHTANFNLSYFNGAEVLSLPASVDGSGLTAAVLATLSGNSYTFPNVVVGTPAPVTELINVSFVGSVPADNVVITAPSNSNFQLSLDPAKSTCMGGAINGNCVLAVSFNPTAYSTISSTIGISYSSNGQTRTPISIPISGTGVHPALLSPNNTTLTFSADPAHEAATAQSFTFTNTGGVAPTTISTITNSDTTDFTPTFSSVCTGATANGGTCAMSVGFNPHTAGALSTQLSFSYFDGLTTQTLHLTASGSGTAPLFLTGSQTIDFGNVMIGGGILPAAKKIGLGIYGLTAGSLAVTPTQLSSPFTFPGGFPGTGGNCSSSVNPNSSNSCSFALGLSTDSGFTDGVQQTQTFSMAYNDGGTGKGTLSFTAKMMPRNPPVLAFGAAPSFPTLSVKNTETEDFTITNNSPYFATAYISTGSLASPFAVTNNTCSGGVAANGSCKITVKFSPTVAGTFNGTLSYVYSDTISNKTISTSFSAIGSPDVTLVANPTTIDFGNVYVGDTVAPQTIALTYYGASNWTAGGTVSAPFTLSMGSCGNQGDCQLTIGLQTTAQVTSANQTLNFTYTPALGTGKIAIILKANIQYRQATLSLSPTTFSNTLQGAQTTQSLTLTNTGSGTASSLTINHTLGSGYSISGGTCLSMTSLNSAQSCTISVVFAPTAVGNATTTLNASAVSAGSATPVPSAFTLSGNGTQLIQVFAGGYQTCIIDELDNAVCWGANGSGQLGQGNTNAITTQPHQMTKISFGSGVQVLKIAVGSSHACALLNTPSGNGKVSCWGNNSNGRLGLGSATATYSAPVEGGALQLVNLGTESGSTAEVATDIAAGFEHTCALLKSGKVKCWGGNGSGQLGIGTTQDVGASSAQMGNSLAAVNLNGSTPISISAGAGHTCAAMSDGGSKCWGDNYFGQLGQGVTTQFIGSGSSDMASLQDISLGSGQKASAIYASSGAFTCALLKNGSVKCFGETDYNNGSDTFWGVLGTCWARPIYNSAAVACWTNPNLPQTTSLGYYTTDMGDNLPVVSLPNAVSQLSLGSQFVCTLGSDSNVRCWGVNDHGQLGIGNANNEGAGQNDLGSNLTAALSPAGGASPISVATGYEHACSVLNNNTVKCWGTSSQNATGLVSFGISNDTGGTSSTLPSGLQVVYDGR
jgi:alpha-tubulin suppressor-like RCC1 family protein